MAIEIHAVGGFGEVGRNMTAVKVGGDVLILDMGLHMPNYIRATDVEREELVRLSREQLRQANAVPDDSAIEDWRKQVRAIVLSHAHLDHIGAIPYLAQRYDCPIICTPYTAAVLRAILRDDRIKLPNEIIEVKPNGTHKINESLSIEMVNITHSIPQASVVALHTNEGIVLYTNDFKLDKTPTLGKPVNFDALKVLGDKGVKVAFIDALYSHEASKTPSEAVARDMLKEVLIDVDSRGKAILVTTFSSHIARLKSICEFARQLKRKVVFIGRSLTKYIYAAKDASIIDLTAEGKTVKYAKQMAKVLKQVERHGREKYLLVVTGHQGEPKSVLSRIADGKLNFKFMPEDHVVFSCKVIPVEINRQQRRILEEKLKSFGVRIFRDVHCSGHPYREDLKDFMKLIKAECVIPSHCDEQRFDDFLELAEELGYSLNKNLKPLLTGQRISID